MARNGSYNPLLKSYPDSDRVNAVSEGAEVLYCRLIAASDDAGRYYGDANWVLSKLFTARSIAGTVTAEDMESRLRELERAEVGLIRRYRVSGMTYLEMPNVYKTLRTDVKRDVRFPDPPEVVESSDVTDPGRTRNESGPDAARVRNEFGPPDPHQTHTRTTPEPDPHHKGAAAPPGGGTKPTKPVPVEVPVPPEIDSPQFREAWCEYVSYRRERKLPALVPRSVAGQYAKLARWGPEGALESIRNTISNGWQGLFDPKESKNGKQPARDNSGPPPAAGVGESRRSHL